MNDLSIKKGISLKINKKAVLVIYLGALLLALSLKYFAFSTFSIDYLTYFFAVAGIILDPFQLIAVMLFTIPFVTVLKTGIMNFIFILIFIVKRYMFNKSKIRIKEIGFLFLFLAFWEILHIFIQPFSFIEYIKVFSLYFLIALLSGDDIEKEYCSLYIHSFVWGAVSFSLLLFIYEAFFRVGSFSKYIMNFTRLGTLSEEYSSGYTVIYQSTNFIALICAMGIACLLLMTMENKKSVLYYFQMVFLFFIGLLTQSKSFIVGIAVILLFLLLSVLKPKHFKKTIAILVSLLIIGAVLYFLYDDFFKSIADVIKERFVSGGLSSRDTLFVSYFDYCVDNIEALLFGIGIQETNTKVGIGHNPHSMFIEVLVSWGIVGVFVVLFIVFSLYKKNGRSLFDISNLPLWLLVIMTQSSRLFKYQHTMILIILLLAVIGQTPKHEGKLNYEKHSLSD